MSTTSAIGIPDPPERLVSRTGGELVNGPGHLLELQQHAGLQPHESVLDIGCGVGKTAIPLASYLSDQGAYEGFDLDRESIEWGQEHITARRPNFRFTHLDIYSGAYNSAGSIRPEELILPYDDEQFDLAFGFSLFTHILPDAFENYCSELRRVLKSDTGRILATTFLLTEENREILKSAVATQPNIGHGQARLILESETDDYSVGVHAALESMVVYKEAFVRDLFQRHGFRIEAVSYGNWVEQAMGQGGRPQDIVVAYLE